LGIAERAVYKRRRNIEEGYGIKLQSPRETENRKLPFSLEPVSFEGPVVIFSDAHFTPKTYTDALSILIKIIKYIKPVAIVDNGDSFDGSTISRHSRIGWDHRPSVKEELEANKECIGMIEKAAPKAELFHNYGNHCLRFDTFLASRASEFEGVKGMSLKDHFPKWKFQWGLMVNDSCVIKHRYKGGVHAAHNNTLWAGKSMVTGHTHRLQIRRFSDYSGTRYGVECGTLADLSAPIFDYTEGAPLDQQEGFVVAFFEGSDHWFEAVEVKRGGGFFAGRKWTP
jgi:UDP-2,3-diacylglucosamine pyrophosphatase LpxH